MTARGFPPPWSVEEQPACFVVNDSLGLSYFRFDCPVRTAFSRFFSMFLTRCADISHASAIAKRARLASGSLNVWASCWHLSAFSRYCSTCFGMHRYLKGRIIRCGAAVDLNQVS